MRLINIDELKGCAIIRPHSREDMKAIKSCSEVIPHNEITTAYDIDKVVEQLEDHAIEFEAFGICSDYVELTHAIAIVKGGTE